MPFQYEVRRNGSELLLPCTAFKMWKDMLCLIFKLYSRMDHGEGTACIYWTAFHAACQQKIFACHLWHTCHRFATPALATSQLDSSNEFCMGVPLKVVQKFQLVQNAEADVVTWVQEFDSVRLLLWELYLLPIHFWAQFKMLILCICHLFT